MSASLIAYLAHYSLMISPETFNLTLCIVVTLANSEDPDEMSHNVVFHQGTGYTLCAKTKTIFRERNTNLYVKPQYMQWIIPNLL